MSYNVNSVRLWVGLIFCFLSGWVYASQQHDLSTLDLKVLNSTDGFPNTEIQKVYQDREGFMWFATRNGLCKYDGYKITVYSNDQLKYRSLTNNNILCIADDNKGSLWIGTYSGMNKFDKATGTFEQIAIQNSTGKSVSCILITKNKDILIGLDDGLFVHDPQTNIFVHHSLRNMGDVSINAPVKSLMEDDEGDIWIGTWNRGLFRYAPAQYMIYSYPILNPRNSAHVIYQDSRRNIWIGTWEGGLHLLKNAKDPANFRWKTFRHHSDDPSSLSDNIVYDICEDTHTHSLWIGTRSGLSILEYDRSDKFINYSATQYANKLPNNEINSIISDSNGNIWLGSIGGGVMFTNTEKPKFDLFGVNLSEMPSGAIRSVLLDEQDNMWLSIGTYGIVYYDNLSQEITPQFELAEFQGMKQNTTYEIKRLPDNRILFATYGDGLWIYEKGTPVSVYTEQNSSFIIDNRIRSLYTDQQHNCWIGTQSGLGVRFDDGNGVKFEEIIVDDVHLESVSMIDIVQDQTGRMWVATINHGIIALDGNPRYPDSIIWKNYAISNEKITSNTVISLFVDRSGRLWAGAESGKLYLYDKKTDRFIDKSPRFSILGNTISSIQEDNEGNLWIATNKGLVRLSFDKMSELSGYRIYTTADGLHDNFFIPNASFRHKNELFFGSYQGLIRFQPNKIETDISQTPFYITDIQIHNQSFANFDLKTANSISVKLPPFSERITIKHEHNNFSIHFAALNYKNPELNRYAYKLEGFDSEWRFADSKQNAAFYNNLPAGRYIFLLRATTLNGVWNDATKELKITVLPPFWFSWWAILIYICFVVFIGFLIFRNIENRIRLRNQLRYREIEQAKAEELNHAKLQFFTNITHEFLTPLTIISATVDELRLTSPGEDTLYHTLTRNINRLTRLLQQILEFRKAESGNLRLRVSCGNISRFIKVSTESFYPLIKKKKIHFSYVSDPENIQGLFDTDKLDKILYNLISNAAKYVNGGGSIQLTLTYLDEEKDHIRISVKDDGSGISKEDQLSLFQRFYEGDYRRHETTGTGIGLSLVKDLVTLSHGTISVESDKGKGSEFSVVLPIDISFFDDSEIDTDKSGPMQFPAEEIATTTPEKNKTKGQAKTTSILVVEDNEEILQLIHRLLNKEYHVFTAMNGKEALLVLEHEKVDLIVSDIMMPEMDGIELCKLLKNNIEYSHIPIVLLTAKTDEKDRAVAYESGADAFISKPFNMNVLHARIKNLLKSRERVATDFKSQLVFEIKDLNFTNLDEDFLQKAIDCVNRHLNDSDFDQQQFSEEMNVSKSTLYNKLKTLTGLNTSAFITNIRMKAACKIMDQNHAIRISDLAYAVGFNDPKYFSSCFKKEFNMRPSEYVERFSGSVET